jgi:hypothetical protein
MKTKIKSTRTFGVEIEMLVPTRLSHTGICAILNEVNIHTTYEGYTHRVMSSWKLVTDSSLASERGYRAYELVSPILQGQEGLDQLAKVLEIITSAGCKVNSSCGLHVHVGINDYTTKNLVNLVKFYGKHEEEIDMVVAPSRRNSRWCQSLNIDSIWNRLNACENFSDVENILATRYKKLNVFSFRRYGTIEFRQHGGSTDVNKICQWVVLLTNICDNTKKKSTIQRTKGEFKHSVIDVFGRGQNRKTMKFFMDRATTFGFNIEGIFEFAVANRRV